MKKYRRGLRLAACLLALATCAVLLCSCLHPGKADSYTAAMPVIVVGSDNYPPFNYMGTDGAPTGIDVELATEAFGRLGYRVKFVTIDWEKKKELVENDTIDCIWGSFSMDGREEEYQWAGPYLYSRQVVAVRSDSQIYALKDLEGKRAAVQATTRASGVLLHEIASPVPQLKQVNCFSTTEELFAALRKGYVDAIAGHEAMITAFVKGGNGNYRLLEESLYVSELGVAFEKGTHRELAERLTETLKAMEADGTIARIVEKYGLDAAKVVWKGAQK